ncbi:MAG: sulfatase-like hydrolase/transferase [Planctomycetia bacterium]
MFIVSDDHHWRDYAFMGHPHLRTPHLDRLARESLVFPRGYVTSSLCCPSLASIITGRYPHEHRIVGNDPPGGKDAFEAGRERMNRHLEEWPTLPRLLGAAGYSSLQTGKWWQGDFSRGGFTEGMTKGRRHGDEGLSIGRQTMQPIFDFLARSRSAGKPFFVWYAPMLPHDPHDPAPELVEHYRSKTDSVHVARYWGNVERFDRTVGDLLDYLDREKLSENTLVVYVTDNGWIQSADNPRFAPRSKLSPYDGGLRTPIMLRRPGMIQPRQSLALASAIDIMPTVLAACGVRPPAGLPGVNLLDDAAVAARREVFGECYTHTLVDLDDPAKSLLWRWTVRDRWKLIVPTTAGSGGGLPGDEGRLIDRESQARYARGEVELFDVETDPDETKNLAATHPDVVADLRATLDAWWNPASPTQVALAAAEAEKTKPARLLVVTVTMGFRHASIATAEPALEEIGRTSGLFHVDYLRLPPARPAAPKPPKRGPLATDEAWAAEQAAFKAAQEQFQKDDAPWQALLREQVAKAFAPESLALFDGVIFASTTGELPIPDLAGFLAWIKSGKAFIGFHAATDTLKSSDAYCEMVGGYFAGHPWNAVGEHAFVVHDPAHPVAAMFPARFRWKDEIYQYDPRYKPENLRVLVSLDMAASTPKEPWHVPVAWVREYGKGRVFATNFGHNDATWTDPMFRRHMQAGIAWALGRVDGQAAPNPDVQAAEYLRSVIAAASAATNASADDLLAKADAKIAKDPAWAQSLRPMLLELRSLAPDARGPVYAKVIAELEKP